MQGFSFLVWVVVMNCSFPDCHNSTSLVVWWYCGGRETFLVSFQPLLNDSIDTCNTTEEIKTRWVKIRITFPSCVQNQPIRDGYCLVSCGEKQKIFAVY